MSEVLSATTIDWVMDQIQMHTKSKCTPKLKTVERLYGGISSNMLRISFRGASFEESSNEIVLRQITNKEWLEEEPDLISHERAALLTAEQLPFPTPQFLAADPTGIITGTPSLLMSNLQGKTSLLLPDRRKYLKALAKTLSTLHEQSITNFPYQYSPYQTIDDITLPSWTNCPKEWQELLAFRRMKPPQSPYVWIHRDFHPNNILTVGYHITGVVDWINACMGPAGIDVAHCRWNLAMMFGPEVADTFLRVYQNHSPSFAYDVYWDIVALFDVVTDPLEVYAGWKMYGLNGITEELLIERMDMYMLGLWRRI